MPVERIKGLPVSIRVFINGKLVKSADATLKASTPILSRK